ncbi:interaptin-like [Lineus longissimus]|uniref:interaptin-like n=1 Tax=Lineus longissimus TaxID=88925 RepID=UPI002B4EBC68
MFEKSMSADKSKIKNTWKKVARTACLARKIQENGQAPPGSPTCTSPRGWSSPTSPRGRKSFSIWSSTSSLYGTHGSRRRSTLQTEELLEKERQSFLTKVEELKKAKNEVEQEKKQKEIFEEELTKLKAKHEEVCAQLEKTAAHLEKSKFDFRKKAEKCEQQEKDLTHSLDKIRNLEIKTSDLEKAELTLETTRRVLDLTQGRLKMKEVDLKTITSNFEAASKDLSLAESNIEQLEVKVDDLKVQVKEELRRNELIEKNLHSIPEMKESIIQKDKLIAQLKEELEQKNALLQLARKSARDHRDKIRVLERELLSLPHLKTEMEFSHCENMTLKKLLVGKDTLVVQKTQALSLAKEVICEIESTGQLVERLETAINKNTVQATYPHGRLETNGQLSFEDLPNSLFEAYPRSPSVPPKTHKSNERIDVNTPPYTTSSMDLIEYHASPQNLQNIPAQGRLFKTLLNGDAPYTDDDRLQSRQESVPRTNSAMHLYLETREKEGLERPKTATARLTKQMGTFHDFRQEQQRKNAMASRNGTSRQSVSDYGTGSSTASENKVPTVKVMLSRLSKYEKDKLAAEFVHVGDRVMVRLGKKKENGPLTCGVVKFVGRVDKEYASYRLYVGLKLDTPIGDTDGVFKGKRYFQTPHRHGKLVKLSQVVSVLNPKRNKYDDVEENVEKLLVNDRGPFR